MASFLNIWGRIRDLGNCGFDFSKKGSAQRFVRATGQLFPHACPGLDEEFLLELQAPGGCPEEKLQRTIDALGHGVRRLEALEQVLRSRVLEQRKDLPDEVREVVEKGTHSDSFVATFQGKEYELHREEIAPGHAYCLVLEVHSGGPYWAGVSTRDANVQHRVETITSMNSSINSTVGDRSPERSAERGAVLAWRWQRIHSGEGGDISSYGLPAWLAKVFATEGDDPLQKLQGELSAVQRWEESMKSETAKYSQESSEIKNPYIKEVLRLWPSETDIHGNAQLKRCAWIEGLEPHYFIGKTVTLARVSYDADHAMILRATIGRRHIEEPAKEGEPPYRLTLSWQWCQNMEKGEPEDGNSEAGLRGGA